MLDFYVKGSSTWDYLYLKKNIVKKIIIRLYHFRIYIPGNFVIFFISSADQKERRVLILFFFLRVRKPAKRLQGEIVHFQTRKFTVFGRIFPLRRVILEF